MGRSAKFHKRQDKKKRSSASSGSALAQQPPSAPHHPKLKPKSTAAAAPTPKEQKKRAGLKDKAKAKATAGRREGERDGPVLGGADYVELMLGGRRKAAAEAAKLPEDPDPDSDFNSM